MFFDTEFQLLLTFQNRLYRIPHLLKQTEMKVRGIIFLSDFYAQSKVTKKPFDFINKIYEIKLLLGIVFLR